MLVSLLCHEDCVHCKNKVPHKHICDPNELNELFTCEYCGEKNVNLLHLCPGKIQKLEFHCPGCGCVAVSPDNLCNPQPIPVKLKERLTKAIGYGSETKICKVCLQPVELPGHVCDLKFPFQCVGCGEEISDMNHICPQFVDRVKFICSICGRLGVSQFDICAPLRLT